MLNAAAGEYVDLAVYEADQRAIFDRAWQLVGPVSELAELGSYIATEFGMAKVLIIRSASDGVLRGFRNVCRHRGARLVPEGSGTCSVIQCPYHQWIYGDIGDLRRAPWFGEEPGFDIADWPLDAISVTEWRGLVFAAIDPIESLTDQLGDLVADLADEPIESYLPAAAKRLEFDANWKIYTDNFIEGYHIPGIHPAFFRAIEFDKFETTARRGYVHMTAPPRDGLIYSGVWLWMWPNTTLSLFPGGMNTSRINPLAVDRTELDYHYYFADHSDATKPERDRAIEGSLAIIREDFEICLHTNRNYRSGAYRPGPLSPLHEQGVAYFQQRLVAARALLGTAERTSRR
jgi:choline monooxygenase